MSSTATCSRFWHTMESFDNWGWWLWQWHQLDVTQATEKNIKVFLIDN